MKAMLTNKLRAAMSVLTLAVCLAIPAGTMFCSTDEAYGNGFDSGLANMTEVSLVFPDGGDALIVDMDLDEAIFEDDKPLCGCEYREVWNKSGVVKCAVSDGQVDGLYFLTGLDCKEYVHEALKEYFEAVSGESSEYSTGASSPKIQLTQKLADIPGVFFRFVDSEALPEYYDVEDSYDMLVTFPYVDRKKDTTLFDLASKNIDFTTIGTFVDESPMDPYDDDAVLTIENYLGTFSSFTGYKKVTEFLSTMGDDRATKSGTLGKDKTQIKYHGDWTEASGASDAKFTVKLPDGGDAFIFDMTLYEESVEYGEQPNFSYCEITNGSGEVTLKALNIEHKLLITGLDAKDELLKTLEESAAAPQGELKWYNGYSEDGNYLVSNIPGYRFYILDDDEIEDLDLEYASLSTRDYGYYENAKDVASRSEAFYSVSEGVTRAENILGGAPENIYFEDEECIYGLGYLDVEYALGRHSKSGYQDLNLFLATRAEHRAAMEAAAASNEQLAAETSSDNDSSQEPTENNANIMEYVPMILGIVLGVTLIAYIVYDRKKSRKRFESTSSFPSLGKDKSK